MKDILSGEIFNYDSLRLAGKELNSNHNTISKYLKIGQLFRNRNQISKIVGN